MAPDALTSGLRAPYRGCNIPQFAPGQSTMLSGSKSADLLASGTIAAAIVPRFGCKRTLCSSGADGGATASQIGVANSSIRTQERVTNPNRGEAR